MTIKIKPEIKKYTGIALVPNKAIVLTVENGKIGIKDEFESNTGKIQAFVWLDGKQATSHAVNGILSLGENWEVDIDLQSATHLEKEIESPFIYLDDQTESWNLIVPQKNGQDSFRINLEKGNSSKINPDYLKSEYIYCRFKILLTEENTEGKKIILFDSSYGDIEVS